MRTTTDIAAHLCQLRQRMQDFPIRTTPDPTLQRDLKPGFLLPYLLEFDQLTYGRWGYWLEAMEKRSLPERPIPPIDFLNAPDPRTRKMIETTLNTIPRHGSWQSLSGWEYVHYLLQWLLWGFGHPGYEEPVEPEGCEGATFRVYQTLNICAWMLWPFDYLGHLLAESGYGKRQGFFPTPMNVCILLAAMLMEGTADDLRLKTVCDPAVGTGRLLLAASNYSLRPFGIDIDPTLCLATLVNGYLFAPWIARPLPFLQEDRDEVPARDDAASTLLPSEPAPPQRDGNDTKVVKKSPTSPRRRTSPPDTGQGSLF